MGIFKLQLADGDDEGGKKQTNNNLLTVNVRMLFGHVFVKCFQGIWVRKEIQNPSLSTTAHILLSQHHSLFKESSTMFSYKTEPHWHSNTCWQFDIKPWCLLTRKLGNWRLKGFALSKGAHQPSLNLKEPFITSLRTCIYKFHPQKGHYCPPSLVPFLISNGFFYVV